MEKIKHNLQEKMKTYKVTFESSVHIGKTEFMGRMVDTKEGRLFDYIVVSDTKENAIIKAHKVHTLPINNTKVIDTNPKYFINTSTYKYGDLRETELETFDTKKDMDEKYSEYIEWFKLGRKADDKWFLVVICSDGRTKEGNIDC